MYQHIESIEEFSIPVVPLCLVFEIEIKAEGDLFFEAELNKTQKEFVYWEHEPILLVPAITLCNYLDICTELECIFKGGSLKQIHFINLGDPSIYI